MPIYEARPEGLQPLTATSFEAEGWRERGDIQRLLKDRIASLEDGLMVLTDEFSGWADSTRRIDLLCLDDEANLVVVELIQDRLIDAMARLDAALRARVQRLLT